MEFSHIAGKWQSQTLPLTPHCVHFQVTAFDTLVCLCLLSHNSHTTKFPLVKHTNSVVFKCIYKVI